MLIEKLTLGEMVLWDEEMYPAVYPGMRAKYGPGPFKIVGLYLLSNPSPGMFPYTVTVELPNGDHQSMTGGWFKRQTEIRKTVDVVLTVRATNNNDFHAAINGDNGLWDCGKTETEAILNVIKTHKNIAGFEINVRWNKDDYTQRWLKKQGREVAIS